MAARIREKTTYGVTKLNMKAGEFIRKLKQAVIEEGYTVNQLTLNTVEHKHKCFKVELIDSRGECICIYLDDEN